MVPVFQACGTLRLGSPDTDICHEFQCNPHSPACPQPANDPLHIPPTPCPGLLHTASSCFLARAWSCLLTLSCALFMGFLQGCLSGSRSVCHSSLQKDPAHQLGVGWGKGGIEIPLIMNLFAFLSPACALDSEVAWKPEAACCVGTWQAHSKHP